MQKQSRRSPGHGSVPAGKTDTRVLSECTVPDAQEGLGTKANRICRRRQGDPGRCRTEHSRQSVSHVPRSPEGEEPGQSENTSGVPALRGQSEQRGEGHGLVREGSAL